MRVVKDGSCGCDVNPGTRGQIPGVLFGSRPLRFAVGRVDIENVRPQLTVLLHDGQDLDNDLGRRSDEDLSLSSSLGVDDVVLKSAAIPALAPLLSFLALLCRPTLFLLHTCNKRLHSPGHR